MNYDPTKVPTPTDPIEPSPVPAPEAPPAPGAPSVWRVCMRVEALLAKVPEDQRRMALELILAKQAPGRLAS